MSDQNILFHFSEEKATEFKNKECQKDSFLFFLKLICVCLFSFGMGTWLLSSNFKEDLMKENRQIQSVENPFIDSLSKTEPYSVLVRLKTEEGFQLTKIEVAMQVSGEEVLEELETASSEVRSHLIFILSNQTMSMFTDEENRQKLKKEIISQLNLFLIHGRVENIELTETFLQ